MTKVEANAWWFERLYGTELAHPTATVGKDNVPSSSCRRDPSPASPVPSLPSADISFLQPTNPWPSYCRHCDESAESVHSTMTQSTRPTSSGTLASIASRSSQSSQTPSQCRDAQLHCAQSFEAFADDCRNSELMARDVQSCPLGCGLGNSLRPLGTRSSILASSLKQHCADNW